MPRIQDPFAADFFPIFRRARRLTVSIDPDNYRDRLLSLATT
jgi:hypothetical protein